MNQTPLMAAAGAGNVALAEALLERGASRDATDQYGCNALHIALRETFRDLKFARGAGAALYKLLAPAHVDVKVGERLVRIDQQLSEYFLFQTFWTLFKSRFTRIDRTLDCGLDTKAILQAWNGLPESVLRTARNRRQHLSHVLSRNEVARDYAYNRALFRRVAHGWYQFNPVLEVRCQSGAAEASWRPVFAVLNLPLIGEFSTPFSRDNLNAYLTSAGILACPAPIMAEREFTRLEAAARRREEERRAQYRAPQAVRPKTELKTIEKPPWGTPEARLDAMMELQRQIDASRDSSKHEKKD